MVFKWGDPPAEKWRSILKVSRFRISASGFVGTKRAGFRVDSKTTPDKLTSKLSATDGNSGFH
jgi:hypothetical protein